MLTNHIALDNRATMEEQKKILLLGLGCHRNRTIDTTGKILSRLKTIEEADQDILGYCHVDGSPHGIVTEEIIRISAECEKVKDSEQFKMRKTVDLLAESLSINVEAAIGFENMVQGALI